MQQNVNHHDVNLFVYLCLQEEVLSLRRPLRCLHPRWPPCHETEGEVWAEETSGAVVAHARCVQVRKLYVVNGSKQNTSCLI